MSNLSDITTHLNQSLTRSQIARLHSTLRDTNPEAARLLQNIVNTRKGDKDLFVIVAGVDGAISKEDITNLAKVSGDRNNPELTQDDLDEAFKLGRVAPPPSTGTPPATPPSTTPPGTGTPPAEPIPPPQPTPPTSAPPQSQTPIVDRIRTLFNGRDFISRDDFKKGMDLLISSTQNDNEKYILEQLRSYREYLDYLDGKRDGTIKLKTIEDMARKSVQNPDLDIRDITGDHSLFLGSLVMGLEEAEGTRKKPKPKAPPTKSRPIGVVTQSEIRIYKELDKELLKSRITVDDWSGPVVRGVFNGDIDRVRHLLSSRSIRGGTTSLNIAAAFGNKKMVGFLLEKGAEVDHPDYVYTPVYFALWNNHFEIAKLLINEGAELNIPRNRRGERQPLLSVAKLKLKHDSSFNKLSEDEKKQLEEIIKLLESRGARE